MTREQRKKIVKQQLKHTKQLDIHFDMLNNRLKTKHKWETTGSTGVKNNGSRKLIPLTIVENTDTYRVYGSEKYYHLTSKKNWEQIQKEGLIGKQTVVETIDGEVGYTEGGVIFTVKSDNKHVWNHIGYNQLCNKNSGCDVVVIEINKEGFKGSMILGEDVSESVSLLHRVIVQEHIEPQYLKQVDVIKTSRFMYYESFNTFVGNKIMFYNMCG